MRRKLTRCMAIGLMFVFFVCLATSFWLKLSITHDHLSKDAFTIFKQLNVALHHSSVDYDALMDTFTLEPSSSVYVVDTTNNRLVFSSSNGNDSDINQVFANHINGVYQQDTLSHVQFNGKWYCGSSVVMDNYRYLYLYPSRIAFLHIVVDLSIYAMFYLLMIGVALVIVNYFMDRNFVKPMDALHLQLSNYQHGHEFTPLKDSSSSEMAVLSNHIAEVLHDKKDNYTKILSALESSQIRLGIVESNPDNTGVVTSRVKDILHLDNDQYSPAFVVGILDELMHQHPINNDHIYPYAKDLHCFYLKIDTYRHENSVIYIIMDMTDTVLTQQRIEHERDIDVLTSLYNRRGFYDKLDELFNHVETLKYSAMILIDMDRLKYINDTFGHTMGDNYIEALANIVTYLPYANYIPCRLGGDEFAIFTYGYESLDQLAESINLLRAKGSTQLANLPAGPVEFSIGFAICPDDGTEFRELMRIADERMYLNKQMKRSGMK